MDSCSPKPMSPYYTSQPSSAFPWPAPSPPSTKHSSHSPSNEVTIKEILDRYKDNPELLKHVLIAKAEEDKRQAAEDTLKTEQARIHLRQMDIDFIREQTKLGRSMSEKTHYPSHPQKYQVSYYGLAPVQQQVLARITGSDTTYQSYSPPSISEPYPHSPSPPVYPHSAHPLCPAPIPSYYPHTHYHAPAPASASILDNRSSSSSNSSSNNTHNNIFRPSHLQARHHPLPQQQQQSHPTITTSPASKSAEARPAASLPAHSVPAHPVSAHPVPTHSVPASPLDQESRKRSRQSISAGNSDGHQTPFENRELAHHKVMEALKAKIQRSTRNSSTSPTTPYKPVDSDRIKKVRCLPKPAQLCHALNTDQAAACPTPSPRSAKPILPPIDTSVGRILPRPTLPSISPLPDKTPLSSCPDPINVCSPTKPIKATCTSPTTTSNPPNKPNSTSNSHSTSNSTSTSPITTIEPTSIKTITTDA